MELIDLTLPIVHGMPSYPGEPGAHFLPFARIEAQGWASHQLLLYTHLGTHLDAPGHFLTEGGGVDSWPLDQLVGPALVAKLRRSPTAGEVVPEDFVWPRAPKPGERVLLATGWGSRWGSADYFVGFPSLSLSLVEFLVQAGVVLVGMDTPTPHETLVREVHTALLSRRVAVLEGLWQLERVPHPFGELICLPLPLVGMDGSPARVVFRPRQEV